MVQKGEGVTAETQFSKRQGRMGSRESVHGGGAVPYRPGDCWDDTTGVGVVQMRRHVGFS